MVLSFSSGGHGLLALMLLRELLDVKRSDTRKSVRVVPYALSISSDAGKSLSLAFSIDSSIASYTPG